MHALLASVLLLAATASPTPAPIERPDIKLTKADGTAVTLIDEDTTGIKDRPLVATRRRLEEAYGKGFLTLAKIDVPDDTELSGSYLVPAGMGPMRITLYEIAKPKDGDRTIKVLASAWRKEGETAAWKATIKHIEEHVYVITAEGTSSPDELDSHLKFMESQGDEIRVKGFGTNWNLSKLKFEMTVAKKAHPEDDPDFSKDADWLVSHLIKPKFVVSIRVD